MKEQRRIRMLYAHGHEVLGSIQIPYLVKSGFEVVRSFSHVLYGGEWSTPVKKIDDPFTEINQLLKKNSTLSPETRLAIQKINIFGFTTQPFTIAKKTDWSTVRGANLTQEEKELINNNIDVIFCGPFPTVVADIVKWFKGVCIVGFYGIESGINNYALHADTKHIWEYEFSSDSNRIISAFFFQKCIEKEHELFKKNSVIMPYVYGQYTRSDILDIKWRGDKSELIVSTNMSYLPSSEHARVGYNLFKKYFCDVNHAIYGKNESDENDVSIKTYIPERQEMLKLYSNSRVFVSPDISDTHVRYTPFENIAMNIPTLFLRNTVIGNETEEIIGLKAAKEAGMCENYNEMKNRAKKCLQDIEYAKDLSINNQIILDKVFTEQKLLEQAHDIYIKCRVMLPAVNDIADIELQDIKVKIAEKKFQELKNKKNTRILWGMIHNSLRSDELPRFFKAGFEAIPIKMVEYLRKYEGLEYDNEELPNYPSWRKNCTLPSIIIQRIRDIQLCDNADFYSPGNITKRDIEILNKYVSIIYIVASVRVPLKLLQMNYKGIILFRHFGHYILGLNGVNHVAPSNMEIKLLSKYKNVIYCPGLHSLIRYEDPRIGNRKKMAYIGYLARRKEDFIKYKWKGLDSKSIAGVVMSAVSTNLFNYYSNFIKHFSHLPYKIWGKNTKEEMESRTLKDDGIVGQLEKSSDMYKQLSYARVYIEPGMVEHHCHYTPLEAVLMEIPIIFWKGSGFAAEAMVKFSAAELYEMGMCATWDEMTVMAEKCLSDVNFAMELSKKQRPLEGIVTEEDIIDEMLAFKAQIPSILKKISIQRRSRILYVPLYKLLYLVLCVPLSFYLKFRRFLAKLRFMQPIIKLRRLVLTRVAMCGGYWKFTKFVWVNRRYVMSKILLRLKSKIL